METVLETGLETECEAEITRKGMGDERWDTRTVHKKKKENLEMANRSKSLNRMTTTGTKIILYFITC